MVVKPYLLALSVVLLMGTMLLGISRLEPGDPLASVECNNCHIATDGGTAQSAQLLLLSQELLCNRCHKDAVTASHPSGITPSMAVPSKFPLDWKGDLTCSSCHHIHQGGHGRLRSRSRGKPFCIACHPQNFFTLMAKNQPEALPLTSHTVSSRPFAVEGLDPYSVECMGCHDERVTAPNLRVTLTDGLIRHQSGTNHPVGVDYQQVASHARQDYRAIQRVPPEVTLPDGKISCISCHRAYSQKHGAIVAVKNLCSSCHTL